MKIEYFFEKQLYNNKTELCQIMNDSGSDKGNGHHNYTTFYHFLFENIKLDAKNIFELGLGTNNLRIPSNMSGLGTPCGSLRGWRKYFENANIYGADIDSEILVQEERISTYYCNQLDKNSIENIKQNFDFEFDLVIEDGLHTFEANISFFECFIDKVRKGGFYIIEDIDKKYFVEFEKYMNQIKKDFELVELVKIPNPSNLSDNNLLLIKK